MENIDSVLRERSIVNDLRAQLEQETSSHKTEQHRLQTHIEQLHDEQRVRLTDHCTAACNPLGADFDLLQ